MLHFRFNYNKTNYKESQLQFNNSVKYKGTISAIFLIFKEEGFRGFTKGVMPRIINQAPSSAISWATYETVKKYLINREKFKRN